MNTHAEKNKEHKSSSAVGQNLQKEQSIGLEKTFQDRRPEAVTSLKVQQLARTTSGNDRLKTMQAAIQNSSLTQKAVQFQAMANQSMKLVQRHIIIDGDNKFRNKDVEEVWKKFKDEEEPKDNVVSGDKKIIDAIIRSQDPEGDVTWDQFVQLVESKRAPRPSKKRKSEALDEKSPQQLAWEERKAGLAAKVEIANQNIRGAKGELANFFDSFLDVPANIRVKIASLKEAVTTHLDREHSRLANFSMSVLAYSKQNLSANNRSPEIQTAILEGTKDTEMSLEISGNKAKANEFLSQKFKGKSLEKVYDTTIKPFHISEKSKSLEKIITGLTTEAIGAIKVDDTPVKRYKFDKKSKTFTASQVLTEEEFTEKMKYEIAYEAHKQSKESEQNRRRRSSRALVKKGKGLGKAKIGVPENLEEIHAESAILKKVKANTDRVIKIIGGTKVACTACQTYYTESGLEELLSDRTSFAWLSESSITQLGFEASKVTEYLEKIKKVLNDRLEKLQFYEGKSGTIAIDDMSEESEVDTDSEDEGGISMVLENEGFNKKVEEVKEFFFL
jgi:hypothetical protein